ncbi:MAG: GTP-dependent dephospho-CoA kinase family protein [Candidatus Aenigmarchaeota archaeon]|nr:GTP-dependent dephospho-CoA kinase family protein [Candidatus Aenigmarchaeota archaeon]
MYRLPKKFRDQLRELMGGTIFDEDLNELRNPIISVGDMVTLSLYEHEIIPKICIVDYKTKRGKIDEESKRKIKKIGDYTIFVKNPPGTISDELWNSIEHGIKSYSNIKIEVDGEEDLAALPSIYLAEDGTNILYGIPERGMALVVANKKNKKIISEFLNKMPKEKYL